MLELRKSEDRGHVSHEWLDSYHSFSFDTYYDPDHMGFGPLRVINEDWIGPSAGFGMHPHSNMEIITYVLEGELAHRDSLGKGSILHAGGVQRMSAGKGVRHSESNASAKGKTHLLQIWIKPDELNVMPDYEDKYFPSEEKNGRLRLIASRDGNEGSARIHQDARVYAGLFDGSQQAVLPVSPERMAYVHLVRGSLTVNGAALSAGDAAKIRGEKEIRLSDGLHAEVIVFDLPAGK